MLYQSEVGRMGPQEAISAFWKIAPDALTATPGDEPADRTTVVPDAEGDAGLDPTVDDALRAFANDLVRETLARVQAIDQLLVAHAHNWRLERMAVIDRLVLRLATCELLTHPETPSKVVINEALELTRTFSGDESVAFVNGVLDAVRKAIPPAASTRSPE